MCVCVELQVKGYRKSVKQNYMQRQSVAIISHYFLGHNLPNSLRRANQNAQSGHDEGFRGTLIEGNRGTEAT